MPFNSIIFLVFFILFTLFYYCIGNNRYKIILLIVGSWIFYSYANIFNLIHLLIATVVTYYFAVRIRKEVNNKIFLAAGILLLVLQLFLSKYSFVLTKLFSINSFTQNQFTSFVFLPIGISFYSLQAISLLVDIQNRKYNGEIDFKNISLFLSFFPQSISGPIHRGNDLIPQFNTRKVFQASNIVIGLKTIIWGYFCKLIVADKISILITPIFNSYIEIDGLSILIGALLYSFQIYFDFWGYSLIAIGFGRILGFNININFVSPYSVTSFKDFWHRWHITLSKWMRDYIYIPLGGRKQNSYFLFCCIIFITFLVSGFWHGITLNFIIWGAAHAFLYLMEDIINSKFSTVFRIKGLNFPPQIIRFLKALLFFVLISLTWLIFKTDNTSELIIILKKIFAIPEWSNIFIKQFLSSTNFIYLIIIFISLYFSNTNLVKKITENIPLSFVDILTDYIFVFICITMIILFGDIGGQEFLYFRF